MLYTWWLEPYAKTDLASSPLIVDSQAENTSLHSNYLVHAIFRLRAIRALGLGENRLLEFKLAGGYPYLSLHCQHHCLLGVDSRESQQ